MSFNLIRNSRIFFTTSVDSNTGVVDLTGLTTSNTKEIQVLDGFSFSQSSGTDTVTLNEAGVAPVRGQRSYNTSLAPVDFSFTTYIRPFAGTTVTAEEGVMWNALFSATNIGGAGAAWSETSSYAEVVASNSEKHQLQKFGLVIFMDTSAFIIDNCVITDGTIDFGIDAIATIAWTGQATTLRKLAVPTFTEASGTLTIAYDDNTSWGTVGADAELTTKNTEANYIANKLSTVTITEGIAGAGNTAYTVAITGGSLSINNNVTFLTPSNIGQVNKPITYFTGTRAISGQLTAYLRGGSGNTSALVDALLASADNDDTPYQIVINMGGSASTRVILTLPSTVISIPDISTDQVVSTTINFTAQGHSSGDFDITSANELTVRYYTV